MKTNDLYASGAVRAALGQTLRPGGVTLTRRLLSLADLCPGAVVLDAGCGCGGTLALLRGAGVQALGLDVRPDFLCQAHAQGHGVMQADMAALPVATQSLDAVFCECAWNLSKKEQALTEFFRVLRPGGRLFLTDIFARGIQSNTWPVHCCFAQATDMHTLTEQVVRAGFCLEVLEDHTDLLKKTAADFVFRHGSLHGFWQAVTGDAHLATAACAASAQARPGLFALVARAEKEK